MNNDMMACGWTLNSEYYSSIMHELREDSSYAAIVHEMLVFPEKADTRYTAAIERICSAYMKLLFPHIRSAEDMSPFEFDSFCLQPALEMRSIIRIQMGLIDIKEAGKTVPDIRTKGL